MTFESSREIEKSLTKGMRHYFFRFCPFLGPSLKSSFSELRGPLELCFGYYVGEELGGNRNLMWNFENLTWISPFWSSDHSYPDE